MDHLSRANKIALLKDFLKLSFFSFLFNQNWSQVAPFGVFSFISLEKRLSQVKVRFFLSKLFFVTQQKCFFENNELRLRVYTMKKYCKKIKL